MKLAVVADIHGNLPALEAVVADFTPWSPDHVILAGDLINGTPFSVEVIEYVMQRDWLVIRGNHEFYYLDFGTNRIHPQVHDPTRWQALHFLYDSIPVQLGDYLATLPDDLALMWRGCEPLRVVHGMPGNSRAGVLPHLEDEQVGEMLRDVPQHSVITAHTHMPGERWIRRHPDMPSPLSPNPPFKSPELRSGQWHIINPGSVGLSLNGSAHAHYVRLESVPDAPESEGWRAVFRRVPYDRERTLRAFHERGDLAAGGPIAEMFYWVVVTGRSELTQFFAWARGRGYDPHHELQATFACYKQATRRGHKVAALDPTGHYCPEG